MISKRKSMLLPYQMECLQKIVGNRHKHTLQNKQVQIKYGFYLKEVMALEGGHPGISEDLENQ